MLEKNHEDRPNLSEIKDSDYFKNAFKEFGGFENLKKSFESNFENFKSQKEKILEKIKRKILEKFGSKENTQSSKDVVLEYFEELILECSNDLKLNEDEKEKFDLEIDHLKKQICHYYHFDKFEHYY